MGNWKGCGWVTACARVIEYVVCCCGCCSSYESYYENDFNLKNLIISLTTLGEIEQP